ncbi:MAG: DUF3494 domain-containing protein [Actinomycetia bacterium]|nr:DUF3494 domain-containing protein [Actinomycetes bacterium]
MKLSRSALLIACVAVPAGLIVTTNSPTAQAADITISVKIGSASAYSVLAGSTVTNTGPTTLSRSLGLWPGTSVTGFPPGVVLATGNLDVANATAEQAQSDLTAGYIDGAGRALTGTVPADLAGQVLRSGVYAADGKGPLSLNGTLVLDAHGNTDAVFIFPNRLDTDHRLKQCCSADQRCAGVPRALGGRQLGDARHWLTIRRDHHRPRVDHCHHRRQRARPRSRSHRGSDTGQQRVCASFVSAARANTQSDHPKRCSGSRRANSPGSRRTDGSRRCPRGSRGDHPGSTGDDQSAKHNHHHPAHDNHHDEPAKHDHQCSRIPADGL